MAKPLTKARGEVVDRVSLTDPNAPLAPPPADNGERPLVPAAPLPPVLPDGNDPRAWLAGLGENLNMAPRTQSGKKLTPFEQLRAIADFDMVRCAMQDVKGQILGMHWGIRPREEFKGKKLESAIKAARAWVEMPYARSRMRWRPWVSRVIEEVLSTDALSLYPRRSIGGDPLGLMILDGARIKPLADQLGEPPLPPAPAFQQIIYGRPETNFYLYETAPSKPALWYMPANPRTDSPYGRPPTEMIIVTANLAFRQQAYDLAYFTDGNIPESLLLVAETWKPEQIAAAQKYLDAILHGKIRRRSGGLIVAPHGTFQATKSRDWKPEFVEFMARLVCWAFNVSPLPLVRMMNRASGEVHEESTAQSGVMPLADFIADIVNRYLLEVLEIGEVEFYWLADENADPLETAQVHKIYGADLKVLTKDEIRADIGLDPLTPEQRDELEPEPPPALAPFAGGGEPGKPMPPQKGDAQKGDAEDEDEPASDAVVKAELARWRKVATRLAKDAKPAREFHTTVLPPHTRALGKALLRQAGSDPEAVRDAFQKVWASYAKQQAIVAALRDDLVAWLDSNLPAVQRWAVGQLKAEKAAKPKAGVPLKTEGLFEDFHAALLKGITEGGKSAAIGSGLVFDQPPAEALQWATDHAADLVGMRVVDYDEGGNPILEPNPNPEWAITDTLRQDVRDKVAKAIDEGWSPDTLKSELESTFGSWRAETIARSETAMAYNSGASAVYEDAGIELVQILDGPGCLPEGHDDTADTPDGDPGVLQADAQADGQVWDLDTFNRHLIGHPNCVRAAIAYVGGVSA